MTQQSPFVSANGAQAQPPTPGSVDLRPLQLFFLAAAVFVVSAGYGALLPLLPGWLSLQIPGSTPGEVALHVGFLSGAYTAGVLIGAPIWGLISDRLGRPRILVLGLVGYVASLLLLLLPPMGELWGIYALRAAAGLFVAAVVPVVPALVAAHTPKAIRARRFAWLGAASLLGFLFGPALNAFADLLASALTMVLGNSDALAVLSTRIVIMLSALLGATMMLGLALTLPTYEGTSEGDVAEANTHAPAGFAALWWLSVAVNLVLSGFEIGIVLQGKEHAELSTQQVAMMFAECSLVMLAVNALLFFTALLDKVPPRLVVAAGLLLGMAGLAVLALHETDTWMYIGVGLTSAGTGLVLPVIAFLAAGASHRKLGVTMGALAAAAALGSGAGGWLFGVVARQSFVWLALPLLATLILLLIRPSWWRTEATRPESALSPSN